MTILAVEDLRVRVPAGTVVDGISYAVEPGEVFGIAGESGSGKTMSVLALMGLLPPDAAAEGRASTAARCSKGATCCGCRGASSGGSTDASSRWCSRTR